MPKVIFAGLMICSPGSSFLWTASLIALPSFVFLMINIHCWDHTSTGIRPLSSRARNADGELATSAGCDLVQSLVSYNTLMSKRNSSNTATRAEQPPLKTFCQTQCQSDTTCNGLSSKSELVARLKLTTITTQWLTQHVFQFFHVVCVFELLWKIM